MTKAESNDKFNEMLHLKKENRDLKKDGKSKNAKFTEVDRSGLGMISKPESHLYEILFSLFLFAKPSI